MGIYIKGMDFLPEDGTEFVVKKDEYGTWIKPIGYMGFSMELIDVPEPHGRLIDVDAYCKDLLEEAHRVCGLLKPETIERINRTVDDLKNYPAVVETEGSENHDD